MDRYHELGQVIEIILCRTRDIFWKRICCAYGYLFSDNRASTNSHKVSLRSMLLGRSEACGSSSHSSLLSW